jgi:hypothetical protein
MIVVLAVCLEFWVPVLILDKQDTYVTNLTPLIMLTLTLLHLLLCFIIISTYPHSSNLKTIHTSRRKLPVPTVSTSNARSPHTTAFTK